MLKAGKPISGGTSISAGPSPNALLCIALCPTVNAPLRKAACRTSNALLRKGGCHTSNAVPRVGVPYCVSILCRAQLQFVRPKPYSSFSTEFQTAEATFGVNQCNVPYHVVLLTIIYQYFLFLIG